MTLKKLILLIAVLSLGWGANASVFSSGFYVGMGAGMERMNGQRNERMEDDTHGYTSQVFSHNQDMKKHGPLIDFFGGYVHRFQNFAIGLETFFGIGKVSSEINRNWIDPVTDYECKYKATVEKKNHFGLHAHLGTFLFEKTFVYGLLGFGACQLRYSSEQQVYDSGLLGPSSLHQNQFSQRKLAYSFDYGLGMVFQTGRLRFGVEGYIANMKKQGLHFPFLPYTDYARPNVIVHIKPLNTVIKFKASILF